MPRPKKTSAGFSEDQREFEAKLPDRLDLTLGPGGRLMARVVDGELRLLTPEMGIKRAQRIVRETIKGDESLVDTLMEMRRQEVEDEFGGD